MDGELDVEVGMVGIVNKTKCLWMKCFMHEYKSRAGCWKCSMSTNIEMSWFVTCEPIEFEN